jgi:hypothetical protein
MAITVIGAVALAMAFVVIAGCKGTTPGAAGPMAPEPMPEPPAPPTLVGTWTVTVEGTFVGGESFRETTTLTFTPERFVEAVALERGGELVSDWQRSGTWVEADGVVTRIWLEDGEEHRLAQRYAWGNEARTVLLMLDWQLDEADEDPLEYRRIEEPVPSLVGTWDMHDNHRPTSRVYVPNLTVMTTLTINAEGTYTRATRLLGTHEGEQSVVDRTHSGTWEQDAEHQYLWLMPAEVSYSENGEVQPLVEEFIRTQYVGRRLRTAYAAMDDPALLRWSGISSEQEWDMDERVWLPRTDRPYGDYYTVLVRENADG